MILFIFDIDGTLTKENSLSTMAFRKSVEDIFKVVEYNENWAEYQFDSDTGIIDTILWDRFNRHVKDKELEIFQAYYLKCFNQLLKATDNRIIPVAGAHDFIESLKNKKNIEVALFTGGFPEIAKQKLKMIGIDDSLLCAAAFDGLSRNQIFEKCLSKIKKENDKTNYQVLLFGDSKSDIVISQKYKVSLIGVTTHLTKKEFYKQGIDYTIDDYTNINIKDLVRYGNRES